MALNAFWTSAKCVEFTSSARCIAFLLAASLPSAFRFTMANSGPWYLIRQWLLSVSNNWQIQHQWQWPSMIMNNNDIQSMTMFNPMWKLNILTGWTWQWQGNRFKSKLRKPVSLVPRWSNISWIMISAQWPVEFYLNKLCSCQGMTHHELKNWHWHCVANHVSAWSRWDGRREHKVIKALQLGQLSPLQKTPLASDPEAPILSSALRDRRAASDSDLSMTLPCLAINDPINLVRLVALTAKLLLALPDVTQGTLADLAGLGHMVKVTRRSSITPNHRLQTMPLSSIIVITVIFKGTPSGKFNKRKPSWAQVESYLAQLNLIDQYLHHQKELNQNHSKWQAWTIGPSSRNSSM